MKNTLTAQVESTLRDYPKTRDSDIVLMQHIWFRFYKQHLGFIGERVAICLGDLDKVPREDHIKRIRAKIQNEEGKYPPTTWEVAKKRNFAETEWRKLLGYNTTNYETL